MAANFSLGGMTSYKLAFLEKPHLAKVFWSELLEPRSIFIYVLVLVLTTAALRRFFSPLQHIPGPFWASVTRLWLLKIIINGDQNEQLQKIHEKYGKFVRVAPNEVSVTHPDAVKKLLLTNLYKVYLPLISLVRW